MRLINTHNLKLEEFPDERGLEYAILSHRWEEGEVTFQDMQNFGAAKEKEGFVKISKSCERAREDGYGHIWVDTCCINKESSAELSEAINSMYRWYATSEVCYAFLSDVQVDASGSSFEEQLKKSKWFTRGWTLQELLASRNVLFFNQQWEDLGSKYDLSRLLSCCTGIKEDVIDNRDLIYGRSIAERMSWASRRTTTRVEDIAYCLLGIFAVNMPLLYGEGERAFLRLQEEIIKQTDDHSIFAWPMPSLVSGTGLLAISPAAFASCGSVQRRHPPQVVSPYPELKSSRAKPHTMTNRGLSIQLMALHHATDTYLVRLNCDDCEMPHDSSPRLEKTRHSMDNHLDSTEVYRLAIYVMRLKEDDQYIRVAVEGRSSKRIYADTWDSQVSDFFHLPTQPAGFIEMYIRQHQDFTHSCSPFQQRVEGIRVDKLSILRRSEYSDDLRAKVLAGSWDPVKDRLYMERGSFAILDFGFTTHKTRRPQLIMLGFDLDWNPICYIQTGAGNRGRRLPTDTLLTTLSNVVDGVAKTIGEESSFSAWNILGDRIQGIDVRLESRSETRPRSCWTWVQLRKETVQNEVGWVFSFTLSGGAKVKGPS